MHVWSLLATASAVHQGGLRGAREVQSAKKGDGPFTFAKVWAPEPGATMTVDGPHRLDDNIWETNFGRRFRLEDDLEPVAPMDHISSARTSIGELVNAGIDAHFVPDYMHPDAFPVVEEDANANYSTPWYRLEGSNTVVPADATYGGGNYHDKVAVDHLVDPASRLPVEHYPVQAPMDSLPPFPLAAREDRINAGTARYIDQVERLRGPCDQFSEKCTVQCVPGDTVAVSIGNMKYSATVLQAYIGDALKIHSTNPIGVVSCPLAATCNPFKPCLSGTVCIEQTANSVYDWMGNLENELRCPSGTTLCSNMYQVIGATYAQKGEKTCRTNANVEP